MCKRAILIGIGVVAAAGMGLAQASGGAEPLAFETASVRAHQGERVPGGYRHQMTPLGITMYGVSMGYCIRLAYDLNWVNPFELGGPAWLDPPTLSEYDIVARTGSPVSSDQIKAMLRTLLKERFKLAVHRERRDLPAYDLVLGSGEPNLRASDAGAERKVTFEGREKWVFHHFSMADLALQLGPPMMSRRVVDKTELAGAFDFRLDLARYLADPATGKFTTDSVGRLDFEEPVLRGVREQLGLVLKPGRVGTDVLVIDHVEKKPSDN